ncbi:MAG: hypothetical protein SFY92_08510 [Verrucomicrobiae bacterium]|nr:hypothetical protein [Verrucomicrobiae bacterium]
MAQAFGTHHIGFPITGRVRSAQEQRSFRRQFWQYVSVRSSNFLQRNNSVENQRRLRLLASRSHTPDGTEPEAPEE